MEYTTIALTFSKEDVEKFNTIKSTTGNRRNEYLSALLVIAFDEYSSNKDRSKVFDMMGKNAVARMNANLSLDSKITPKTLVKDNSNGDK